jgi:hypothetical protein
LATFENHEAEKIFIHKKDEVTRKWTGADIMARIAQSV